MTASTAMSNEIACQSASLFDFVKIATRKSSSAQKDRMRMQKSHDASHTKWIKLLRCPSGKEFVPNVYCRLVI